MKKISIGFSKPNSFKIGSFLIRKMEGTEFSHTFLLVDHDIYQESASCFNKIVYSFFLKDHIIVDMHEISISDEKYDEIMYFVSECVNKRIPYGKLQIVGMGFIRLVNQLFRRKFKNPFADGMKTMVCSEVVAEILRIAGHPLPQDQIEIEGPKYIHKFVKNISNCQEDMTNE